MDRRGVGLTLAEQAGDPDILAGTAGVAEPTFWRTGRMRRDLRPAVEIEHDVGRDLDARHLSGCSPAAIDMEARALFALIGALGPGTALNRWAPLSWPGWSLAAGDWPTTERLCDEAITVAGPPGGAAESLCRMLLASLASTGRALQRRDPAPPVGRGACHGRRTA
jgi:hypothetical protein